MPSTFSGLYICLRAMQAQQLSLETYAHNIANAETDGFSRQRAVLETTPPWPMPSINSSGMVGQVGTGVDVARIERLRDAYLDVQIRKEKGILGEWTIKQDTLEQIEIIFQEPTETGLNSLLTQFWDSWLQLSMNSEGTSSAVRTTVVETASSLCDALRHTKMQLGALSEDMDNIIKIKVDQVNSIAEQIDALNNQIKTLKTAGFEPNDLMDQRDLLLDELAGVIDFKFQENDDGTIDVNFFNTETGIYDSPLVDGAGGSFNTLKIQDDSAVLVKGSGEQTEEIEITVSRGELKGLFNSKEMLDQYKEDLETFVANLITEVNAQHTQGYDIDGEPGQSFFWGEPAADFIEVNPNIKSDVSKIAAASAPDGGPGDGSNALAVSRLREKGFDDDYRNLISRLGVDTNESRRMKENQEALVGQLGERKESISGVSIDEELAHMIEC
ncbi:MAG TPA: flagellar hook-associated protein FlgK, partial [Clostridia bacterium]|nr:flagellar hook-associated protein FlgK [Clostridia bacterium]